MILEVPIISRSRLTLRGGAGDYDSVAIPAHFATTNFFIGRPSISLHIVGLYGFLFGCGLRGLVNLAIALNTPAGFSSILLQSSAFMSVVVAVVVFKEDVSTLKLIGVISALVGFCIIVIFRGESVPPIGVALVFTAAGFWTACNTIVRKYKPKDVVSFIAWSSLFVPLPILGFWWIEHFLLTDIINSSVTESRLPGQRGWLSILFQSYVTTLLSYRIWTRAISRHGLANAAPLSLPVPVSGLAFRWLFYNEALSAPELLGATLVILGLVALSSRGRSRAR